MSRLRGVVLAGGSGSRLRPLTDTTNKHLLSVAGQPMIAHPIRKLVEAGLTDILVVTGTDHMGAVVDALGTGEALGCELTYKVQDVAGGIAHALRLARGFSRGGSLCVVLGDNIFEAPLAPYMAAYQTQKAGARLLLKAVPNPSRFGVAELADNHGVTTIVGLEEKPEHPKSDLCVTGVYFFDAAVFDIIETLHPSRRGELEITDVSRAYMDAGTLQFSMLEGWWTDAGTHASLQTARALVTGQATSA
ncbi:MAG: glucose-1-phosphate thymidylyltransferase [Myxococcota bacterium]